MKKIRIECPGSEPLVFDGTLITIGRSNSNMVVLKDSRISSVHGEIVRRSQDFFYRDLGSTNGSMVRSNGVDIVIDGKRVREVRLGDGDDLLLGDREVPVEIRIELPEEDESETGAHTMVARRALGSVQDLGTQVVDNPLASRQTLNRLFAFFGDLQNTTTAQSLFDTTGAFALGLLSKTLFVGMFERTAEGLERRTLMAEDAARTPILVPEDLERWFPDAFAGLATVVIGAPAEVQKRLPQVTVMAAVPLPGGQKQGLGAIVFGRGADCSEFDLDLVSLVGHHAAIQLARVRLIEQLEAANQKLSVENQTHREKLDEGDVERPIIGKSPQLARALKQADLVAKTDTTVLILGETGTGKELLARYVHTKSERRAGRFAAVNCGALAENLLESELFGHLKGAFTGADRDKKGLFQVSDGGTLFLDEIGDISPNLQVRLLRVLEAGEVTPVGSTDVIPVDVRILAATHRDLEKMVAEGSFREDLLYRINVFPIDLPSLKSRVGDVRLLAEHFFKMFCDRLGKTLPGIERATMKSLEGYRWPGNIRELQNEIHRAVLLSDDGKPLTTEFLSDRVSGGEVVPQVGGTLKEAMAIVEEQFIRRVLKEHGNNRTQSAKALGISRQALTEKLRKYRIGRKYETIPGGVRKQ